MLHQKLPKNKWAACSFLSLPKSKTKPRVKFYPWHFNKFKERKEETLTLLDFSVLLERKSHILMEGEAEPCWECWKPNS